MQQGVGQGDVGAGLSDAAIFAVRLRPQRSLTRGGRGWVLLCFGLFQAPAGVFVCVVGAWPAACFVALTWAGLVLAFWRNARDARAYEDLSLSSLELAYVRVSSLGVRRAWRFNPLWVRLAVERHEEFGVERIDLHSRRRRLEIGAFLGRGEKTRLAADLSAALAEARKGPRFS